MRIGVINCHKKKDTNIVNMTYSCDIFKHAKRVGPDFLILLEVSKYSFTDKKTYNIGRLNYSVVKRECSGKGDRIAVLKANESNVPFSESYYKEISTGKEKSRQREVFIGGKLFRIIHFPSPYGMSFVGTPDYDTVMERVNEYKNPNKFTITQTDKQIPIDVFIGDFNIDILNPSEQNTFKILHQEFTKNKYKFLYDVSRVNNKNGTQHSQGLDRYLDYVFVRSEQFNQVGIAYQTLYRNITDHDYMEIILI